MRRLFPVVPLFFWACASPVSGGPNRVDFGPFSMEIPEDMVEVKVTPIDSYVREFKSEALTLTFDYGRYSDSLPYPNPVFEETTTIDGRRARIAEFAPTKTREHFSFAVHFPHVAQNTKLTVYLKSREAVDRDLGRHLFRSIRFRAKD